MLVLTLSPEVAGLIGAAIGGILSVASTIGVEAWRARQARKEREESRLEHEQERQRRFRLALTQVIDELKYNDEINHRGVLDLKGLGADGAFARHQEVLADNLPSAPYRALRDTYVTLATAKHFVEINQPNSASDQRETLYLSIPATVEALTDLLDRSE